MQSEPITSGFCYVANTAAYLDEAAESIRSLKLHMPDARICLIAPRELWNSAPAVDDLREPVLTDRTPIVKNDATLAPYERVAFVDTDTRFIDGMGDVFRVLDAFDIAAAHEPTRGWDYPTPAPHAFCELNTGFFVFRNTPKMRMFFDRWLEAYRELHQAKGLSNDQPSFRKVLWENPEIRLATLPSEYHCIPGKPVSIAWGAILLHGRDHLDYVESEINRETGYRAFLPGLGLVKPFAGRRMWCRLGFRLLLNWLKIFILGSAPSGHRENRPHRWYMGEKGE